MFVRKVSNRYLVFLFCALQCPYNISGHGRLLEPAGRSSMWRFGYNTPVNYNDNQLFCGGYRNTVVHDGKCGACGDPYQGPFENEAGGKYATGTIVRYYNADAKHINVTVDISAHHRGHFEFRLCPNNDIQTRVTQECLDKFVLEIEDSPDRSKLVVPSGSGTHHLRLRIPPGLRCSQCVLQWKYRTGNFWGVDRNGKGCIGCGPQELFVNCADIAIGDESIYQKNNHSISRSIVSVQPVDDHHHGPDHHTHHYHNVKDLSNSSYTYKSDKPEECNRCYALPTWRHFPNMDSWCDINCKVGNCPPCRCYCGCPNIQFDNPCVGTGEYDTFDKMAGWCWRECCESECPIDKCSCSESVKYPAKSGYTVQKQFFDVPLLHMFPGPTKINTNDDSRMDSNESNSSESDEDVSDENETNDIGNDKHDHRSKAKQHMPHPLRIKPPAKTLLSSGTFANLFSPQWTRLPGPINSKKIEKKHKGHSSTTNLDVNSSEEEDSISSEEDNSINKSSMPRKTAFILHEIHRTRVKKPDVLPRTIHILKNRKNHKNGHKSRKSQLLHKTVLHRIGPFVLMEVRRTRVNKTSVPGNTSATVEREPGKYLTTKVPSLDTQTLPPTATQRATEVFPPNSRLREVTGFGLKHTQTPKTLTNIHHGVNILKMAEVSQIPSSLLQTKSITNQSSDHINKKGVDPILTKLENLKSNLRAAHESNKMIKDTDLKLNSKSTIKYESDSFRKESRIVDLSPEKDPYMKPSSKQNGVVIFPNANSRMSSPSATDILSENESLLKSLSQNIHKKQKVVESIINEERKIDDEHPIKKVFKIHELRSLKDTTGEQREGSEMKIPYVIDARLLNKMLKSFESWFSQPMYVAN